MIIAGAGGHALEVIDAVNSTEKDVQIRFFDDNKGGTLFHGKYPVTDSESEVRELFLSDPRFILGTGDPGLRKFLYDRMIRLGGKLTGLRGRNNVISDYADCRQVDIFNLCFIGPNTRIGTASLINTGAQVHHEVLIGEFSIINPGAVLLGASQIGDFCSIGAHATILPGIKIANNVTVGAGAVITRDVTEGLTVVGVPGRVVGKL